MHSASVTAGSSVEQTRPSGQEPPSSLHAGGGGTTAHERVQQHTGGKSRKCAAKADEKGGADVLYLDKQEGKYCLEQVIQFREYREIEDRRSAPMHSASGTSGSSAEQIVPSGHGCANGSLQLGWQAAPQKRHLSSSSGSHPMSHGGSPAWRIRCCQEGAVASEGTVLAVSCLEGALSSGKDGPSRRNKGNFFSTHKHTSQVHTSLSVGIISASHRQQSTCSCHRHWRELARACSERSQALRAAGRRALRHSERVRL